MKTLSPLLPLILAAACTEQTEAPAPKLEAAAAPVAQKVEAAAEVPPAEAREVAIEVTKEGYDPAEIAAQPGESLMLVFTRTSKSRCAEKVVVPAAEVERKLPLNEPVRVTVTAPASGRLGFACGMDMMKGALVVN